MINLRKTTENKLFISRGTATSDEECKPWGVSVFDNTVTITSLTDRESVYSDHFSDFQVDGIPFTSLSDCIEYITPCLGFNTASGGSGAVEYVKTINLSDAQISTIGTNPVILSDLFDFQIDVNQYYDIKQIVWKGTAGGAPYSSERVYFYGCFTSIFPSNSFPSFDDTVAIIRSQSTSVFDDSGSLYPEAPLVIPGQSLFVSTYSGDDPIGGNGTVQIQIKYSIETF